VDTIRRTKPVDGSESTNQKDKGDNKDKIAQTGSGRVIRL